MLYKLGSTEGRFDTVEPLAFKDFGSFGQLEKDLEDLIAGNILGVLFEDAGLMPIFQERQGQQAADIYALDAIGDLSIFELKRSAAGETAVHQALRYAQDAGQLSHAQLEGRFQEYQGADKDLAKEHQEAFDLDSPLAPHQFNRRQHLVVIGSSADNDLINAVDYWRRQGISIVFLPYRIYELADGCYFEFFALPYDRHRNPADEKGVLFDTNRTYDPDSIWYMVENQRVAAFGDAKHFVKRINVGDTVFFSHRWTGIVAAATVRSQVRPDGSDTLYRDVDFVTPVPQRGTDDPPAMPFGRVREITGRSFYWARTIKVPYLSKDESNRLVEELQRHLSAAS
ncbi:MAG: hypothetical protein F4149_00075 [Gammaproteobacteria bacterium]|nr:hypothetical protein [Gammaproteobacteria bacterium]MYK82889.1 hypothetical protein [Gammaproteobacteria bacterium]